LGLVWKLLVPKSSSKARGGEGKKNTQKNEVEFLGNHWPSVGENLQMKQYEMSINKRRGSKNNR